ncbi:MAG: glycosyl hydrolase, partial [Parachlamydiaceae bacterium]|nr:glycosyl hydrolase [Parachlamydiaceae bacterium]
VNTGPYLISYNENGSLKYKIPHEFSIDEDDLPGCIKQKCEKNFSLDSASQLNPHPFIKWRPSQVGNMVRHLVYNQMTFYVAQGSAFQAVSYKNEVPVIKVKSSFLGASFSHSTLDNGVQKYRIKTNDVIYLFYGHYGLNLDFNRWSGTLTTDSNYTGMINAIAIPNNEFAKNFERLADEHSNVVIIRAQGSLLPYEEYQFTYMCENLLGSPTDQNPLIFLKEHHVKNLQHNNLATFHGIKVSSLTGDLSLYSGSTFNFKVPSFNLTTEVIPTLPNGSPGLNGSQINDLLVDGWLEKGIGQAMNLIPSSTLDHGGKEIYQIALTLSYAQKILEISRHQSDEILNHLNPLYIKLTQLITDKWEMFKRDLQWGTLIFNHPESETQTYLKDHLTEYSYLLYSLTLISQFENQFIDSSERFLAKHLPLEGYECYTNKDMGDFIAADIGETGNSPFQPKTRNFDIYQGHSWLSGIDGPSKSGNELGKTSESIFGSFAIYAWLKQTQPDSISSELAKTRWYIETQSLKEYIYLSDPLFSIYSRVSLPFAKKYPVVSTITDQFICHGSPLEDSYSSLLASTISPVGVNQMENFLSNDIKFTKRFSDFLLTQWQAKNNDPFRSIFLQAIARVRPATAQQLLYQLEKNGLTNFNEGTNPFILYVLTLYAANRKLFDSNI